jgi:zinc transporter
MSESQGLLHACVLDGKGGAESVDWDGVRAWTADQGVLWIHLDYGKKAARSWLRQESGIDPVSCSALLAEETRPRAALKDDALLLNLRGANLNPGAEPDDMISLRLWVEERRVVTLRRRRLRAIPDVRESLEQGKGPRDAGDLLIDIIDRLLARMADCLNNLDDLIDGLDERILEGPTATLRADISNLRRQAIALRRYLAPQRDAVARLYAERVSWLGDLHREHLRELADRTTRRVEDLDEARERAAVAHEELASRLTEQMNRTMYILAIVAAIFLPLGLLTGLLGINVGGMPGEGDPSAFWIVCGALAVVAGIQLWLFRRMHWL